MEAKRCAHCKTVQSVHNFHRNRKTSDGLQSSCKECLNRQKREWYARNAETARKVRMDYKRRYPERIAATTKVNTLIRSGKLQRQACIQCGTTKHVDAHHGDYSKPLDIEWLCRCCHRTDHVLEAV